MRANEFITELYDPQSGFKLEWDDEFGPEEIHARAYDRQGNNIDIKFIPVSDDIVDIEFHRNYSYDITGAGDAERVFATVLEAIRRYLRGYQPKILIFSSKGRSRTKLYQRLINRFASTVGYQQFDINKLSPETRERIVASGGDVLVLRKSTVQEAFDKPYKLKWEKGEEGEDYDAYVRLPDGSPLSIMFNAGAPGEYQVEFWRNFTQHVTGEGDAQRIFATVLDAISEFIEQHDPNLLLFSASKGDGDEIKSESRAKLYNRMVQRYASAMGYDAYSEDHGDQVTYELTRKDNLTEYETVDEMAGEIHGGVRKALKDKGYEYLGSGIDKQAYLEPGTGQVLIIFGYRKNYSDFSPDQRMFIDWMNYCKKHADNPHLPKFSGFETFQFQGKNYIQARMEPLNELSEKIGNLVGHLDDAIKKKQKDYKKELEKVSQWATHDSFEMIGAMPYYYDLKDTIKLLGGRKAAANLLTTVYKVKEFAKKHRFTIDLHRGNYMQRPNGTIVVNDPFVLWLKSK